VGKKPLLPTSQGECLPGSAFVPLPGRFPGTKRHFSPRRTTCFRTEVRPLGVHRPLEPALAKTVSMQQILGKSKKTG